MKGGSLIYLNYIQPICLLNTTKDINEIIYALKQLYPKQYFYYETKNTIKYLYITNKSNQPNNIENFLRYLETHYNKDIDNFFESFYKYKDIDEILLTTPTLELKTTKYLYEKSEQHE